MDGVDVNNRVVSAIVSLFMAFIIASKMTSNDHATVMVYTTLNSITEELQI